MLRAKYNYFQNFKSRECVMKLNLKTTGLVLEGGGMRGVFTSGVLDAFMKHDVHFPYTVAVSAGAPDGEYRYTGIVPVSLTSIIWPDTSISVFAIW